MQIPQKLQQIFNTRLDEVATYGRCLYRPACALTQQFAIIADIRTGSTLLSDLLNKHPDIFCDKEIFLLSSRSQFTKLYSPSLYIAGKACQSPRPVYGFDLKIRQFSDPSDHRDRTPHQLLSHLHQQGLKLIYLKRKNLVKQGLSAYLANHRHCWSSKPEALKHRRKIHVKLPRLLEHIKSHQDVTQKTEAALHQLPYLELCYETDLQSSHKQGLTANQVFEYLGISPFQVSTQLKRVSAPHLSEDIRNWEDVIQGLQNTPYASYLEDFTEAGSPAIS